MPNKIKDAYAKKISQMGILTLMEEMKAAVDREMDKEWDILFMHAAPTDRWRERKDALDKVYGRLFNEIYQLMETGNYRQLGTSVNLKKDLKKRNENANNRAQASQA